MMTNPVPYGVTVLVLGYVGIDLEDQNLEAVRALGRSEVVLHQTSRAPLVPPPKSGRAERGPDSELERREQVLDEVPLEGVNRLLFGLVRAGEPVRPHRRGPQVMDGVAKRAGHIVQLMLHAKHRHQGVHRQRLDRRIPAFATGFLRIGEGKAFNPHFQIPVGSGIAGKGSRIIK